MRTWVEQEPEDCCVDLAPIPRALSLQVILRVAAVWLKVTSHLHNKEHSWWLLWQFRGLIICMAFSTSLGLVFWDKVFAKAAWEPSLLASTCVVLKVPSDCVDLKLTLGQSIKKHSSNVQLWAWKQWFWEHHILPLGILMQPLQHPVALNHSLVRVYP